MPLMVPKANLAAGETLIQVEYTITAEIGAFGPAGDVAAGTIVVENTTGDSCTGVTAQYTGTITGQLSDPPLGQAFPPIPVMDMENFGTLNSGQMATANIAQNATLCRRVLEANLGGFVGPGMLRMDHTGSSSGGCDSTNCGNFGCDVDVGARVTLTVNYLICSPVTTGCPCVRDPRSPSSLLLFPEFNNNLGRNTLVSITNANCFTCSNQNLPTEVIVEVVFINKDTCLEDNFNIPLTPCDTFTFLTSRQTNFRQGYLYAFAKDLQGRPIKFDNLVGQEIMMDGFRNLEWSVNAAGFAAGRDLADGALTNLDGDNVRDLDGLEYIEAPERIIIPRFLGQDPFPFFFADYRSTLTFIALSGGAQFSTIVDLAIWNDSEECFSDQHQFDCWDKQFLADISPAFTEGFLDASNNDPLEIVGWNTRESGWLYLNGRTAFSGVEQIQDPAIYALLVEEKGGRRVADLPWEEGCQDNGDLVPTGILGDPRAGFPGGQLGDNQ